MNSTRTNSIEDAKEIIDDDLDIHIIFYLLGIIIMVSFYVGPLFYFKFVKKKNLRPNRNIAAKHSI